MDDMKRCPFCGGIPYVHANWSPKYQLYFVFVKCDICGAQGGITSDRENPSGNEWETASVETAINKWNTRMEEQ